MLEARTLKALLIEILHDVKIGPIPTCDKSRVGQQVACQSLDKLEPSEEKLFLSQLGTRSCSCWGSKEGRQAGSAEGGAPCPRKLGLNR